MAASLKTPIARLVTEPAIIELIKTTRQKLAAYAVWSIETYERRHPSEGIKILREQLRGLTEPQQIKEKLSAIEALSNPGAETVADSLRAAGFDQFEPAREALLTLLQSAKTKLQEYLTEAREAEQKFFAAWGVSPEQTEVTARYSRALASLADHIAHCSRAPNTLPNAEGTALSTWFGLSLVGD